jgi:alpha/beta superfamily hydrolase
MRFDFSGSQIGRGDGQIDQIQEAANFLLAGQHFGKAPTSAGRKPPSYVLLVGYSYGSILSGAASAKIPRCVGVAMISPPLAVRHWLYMFAGNRHLDQCRKRGLPLLMMIGSKDNFTSEQAFMDVVQTMPKQTTTGAVLKDADHFFRGREKDLMDILGRSYTEKKKPELEQTRGRCFDQNGLFNSSRTDTPFLLFHVLLGHWILNVYSQCEGDLGMLAEAEFTILDPKRFLADSNASTSGDSIMGLPCSPCVVPSASGD